MTNEFREGDIAEGVVTGVQPYGAFVSLGEGLQGLVHISEITNGFVKDIHHHVEEGDKIKVKIIGKDEEENKYALSIRALEAEKELRTPRKNIEDKEGEHGFNTLQDKLQEWIKKSQ